MNSVLNLWGSALKLDFKTIFQLLDSTFISKLSKNIPQQLSQIELKRHKKAMCLIISCIFDVKNGYPIHE